MRDLDDADGQKPVETVARRAGADDSGRIVETMADRMRKAFGDHSITVARAQLSLARASGTATESWQAILDVLLRPVDGRM